MGDWRNECGYAWRIVTEVPVEKELTMEDIVRDYSFTAADAIRLHAMGISL